MAAESLFMFSPTNHPWRSDALEVTGGPAAFQVKVDVQSQLSAKVRTATENRDHVHVQFWAQAFGTAGAPVLASSTLMEPADDTVANLSVAVGGELVIPKAWTPKQSDVTGIPTVNGELHVCLLANVFSTDGSLNPVDGQLLTSPPVMGSLNKRQAQVNLTLIVPPPGQMMAVPMFAGNPFEKGEQEFEVEVEQTFPRRHKDMNLDYLMQKGYIARMKDGLGLRAGDELMPIRIAGDPLEELEIQFGDYSSPKHRTVLAAGHPEQILVQANLPEEENVLRFFDVIQRADDVIVGGARIMALALSEEPPVEFPEEPCADEED